MLTRRALLAAGAAATTGPFAAGQARADTPANTIVMAYEIDDAISFDPGQAYEFSTIEVDANIYRKLVAPELNDLSKIGPDVAEHWEVSSDGKSFVFHLGQNALFASGKPVTAADAEFSLRRAVTLNLTPGFILDPVRLYQGQCRATDPRHSTRTRWRSICRSRRRRVSCSIAWGPMSAASSRRRPRSLIRKRMTLATSGWPIIPLAAALISSPPGRPTIT